MVNELFAIEIYLIVSDFAQLSLKEMLYKMRQTGYILACGFYSLPIESKKPFSKTL